MEESTLDLVSSHVASGARLMARQKQIIAEIEGEGRGREGSRAHTSPAIRLPQDNRGSMASTLEKAEPRIATWPRNIPNARTI
jgi:hypothetical protein